MKKQIKLSTLQAMVAERMHLSIQEQVMFVKRQESIVNECLIGLKPNPYDLRQNIQALETGKSSMSALKGMFQTHIGISYDDYCDSIEVEKVVTAEERLIQAIKDIFK
jgi:hypothetical protein